MNRVNLSGGSRYQASYKVDGTRPNRSLGYGPETVFRLKFFMTLTSDLKKQKKINRGQLLVLAKLSVKFGEPRRNR